MSELKDLIKTKKAKIAILGLGYVGLPLAIEFAKKGFQVSGLDAEKQKVDLINQGKSYIEDIKNEELSQILGKGNLKATQDYNILGEVDIIIICVPTPLTIHREPDISYIQDASQEIAKHLKREQLIILESTTYPGTTEEVIFPILENTRGPQKGGAQERSDEHTFLGHGRDFFLAFSPERVDPGNKKYKISDIPKVVGGIDKNSTDLASILYQNITKEIVPVSSPKVAEMSKLLENIFRIVNISMINEMTLLCDRMKIDIWEVIQAAKTKPYGFMPFYPNPGAGGHCIPIDPFYLSWKAKEYGFWARFVELAGQINEQMPHFVVTKIAYALNQHKKSLNGSKILVLGVAYKKDISDTRESPALKIIKELLHKKANVIYNDPHVSKIIIDGQVLKSQILNDDLLKSVDLVLILTDHSIYDFEHITKVAPIIVDTRNAIKRRDLENVYRL